MEDHAPRQMEVEGPCGIARRRDRDERDHQRVDDAARGPDVRIQLPEEHRVGIEEEVERQHAGEPDDERLDRPAAVLRGAPP